jgi:tRNA threonylcarbamoyladenosine modification (KEOPS) complex Cgi121 subunit
MNKRYSFQISNMSNTQINIEYIYGSININNIENYLKRVEEQEKNTKIIIIQNNNIYDDVQLFWSVFIAYNRFTDKINISKSLQKEVLLLLSLTDQINKIDSCFEICLGEKDYFVFFVYENKINTNKIAKNLNIVPKKIVYNKQKAKEYYKISSEEKILEKIIEKISSV